MIGTLSPLVEPFGVPSQGFELLEVSLIPDLSKELVYKFLENHINPLPCMVLMINQVILLSFELPFALGSRTYVSFFLPDVVLLSGEYFDPRHEAVKIRWRTKHQVFPNSFSSS